MNRAPLLFRSLTLAAEKMEQAAWTQLVFTNSDPRRAAQGQKDYQKAVGEMEEWRKVVEEQIKNKKIGKAVDPTKLWLNS